MKDNDSSAMFAGGIILVIIVIGVCLNALKKLFILLGETFNAFGNMAKGFFYMAWQLLLALGLIALVIGCVYAAVYFTYEYYKMVKKGTELKKEVDEKMQDMANQINDILKSHKAETKSYLSEMDLKLRSALDKPDIVPTANPQNLLPAPVSTVTPAAEINKSSSLHANTQNQPEGPSPSDVTNPF